MTAPLTAPLANVPVGEIALPDGRRVPVYLSREYQRLIAELVKRINDHEARITALE